MKKNKGSSIISIILIILILILIVFLGYEILYVDIFDLMKENNETIFTSIDTQNKVVNTDNSNSVNQNNLNIEKIEPIIDNSENNSNNSVNENLNNYISTTYKYFYNQLDQYGKTIYNAFEQNKENMKSGVYKIDFGTEFSSLLNTSNGEETLNRAFQSAWNAYTYDNMDVFYIDVERLTLMTQTTTIAGISTHEVYISNGNNDNYLIQNMQSKENINQKLNLLEAMRKEIYTQLQGYSKYEQIKEVHNWLIDNIVYDTDMTAQNQYSIVGALVEGQAVCEGYARSFKYILDGLGIPCVLVSGTGTNSNGETESHAWNYVQLDGKWYGVDVTWDDPVIIGSGSLDDENRYKYFLKGKSTFQSSHIEDGNITSNSIKFTFPTLET